MPGCDIHSAVPPFDADVPKLTSDDYNFIDGLSSGATNGTARRDLGGDSLGDTDIDTWQKWQDWQMDKWMEAYVTNVYVDSTDPDTGRPVRTYLRDSKRFFVDFWHSAGDTQTDPNPCATITSPCVYQKSDDTTTWRAGLLKDDIYRARFARRAMLMWRNNVWQGYDIFMDAQFSSALAITEIRTNFVKLQQAKPASPLAVILPLLSMLGVFVPGLGPAVSVVGSIVAATSGNTKRQDLGSSNGVLVLQYDADDEDIGRQRSNAIDGGTSPLQPILDTNEPGSLGSAVKGLQGDVKKLQLKAKAAKLVAAVKDLYKGIKAMNPKLQIEQVSTWVDFDARTMDLLSSFRDDIAHSYAANTRTWGPAIVQTPGGDRSSSAGMKTLLAGGAPYKDAPDGDFDVVASRNTIQDFYRKVILMEVLKSQSVYLWRQTFESADACQDWQNTHYRAQKLTDASIDWCKPVAGGGYEIHIARTPFTHDESLGNPVKRDMGFIGNLYDSLTYKAMAIAPPTSPTGAQFFQALNFDAGSAFYDKWNDDALARTHIGDSTTQTWLKTEDIVQLSLQCQASQGNPFLKADATRDDLYKAPLLGNFDATQTNSQNALCLFSLPVLEINDANVAQWCTSRVGKYKYVQYAGSGKSNFRVDNNICVDFDQWAAVGDSIVCGLGIDGWQNAGIRPGCEARVQYYNSV